MNTTTDAPTETTSPLESYNINRDVEFGSTQITASFEAWHEAVSSMRENSDNASLADAVTGMLRAANNDPAPGDLIEVEVMPGTEAEELVDAITHVLPGVAVEGTYSRKAKTTRAAPTTGAKAGAKAKKKATPKECMCGCGEETAGGKFRPGHDARFKGAMLRLIDQGGEDGESALARLLEHPNLYDADEARARFGSGPAKEEAKKAKLAKLAEDKAAKKEEEAKAKAAAKAAQAEKEEEEA